MGAGGGKWVGSGRRGDGERKYRYNDFLVTSKEIPYGILANGSNNLRN